MQLGNEGSLKQYNSVAYRCEAQVYQVLTLCCQVQCQTLNNIISLNTLGMRKDTEAHKC